MLFSCDLPVVFIFSCVCVLLPIDLHDMSQPLKSSQVTDMTMNGPYTIKISVIRVYECQKIS